jgi:predicted glycosyltransferase
MTTSSMTDDMASRPGVVYLEEIKRGIQDEGLLSLLDYDIGINSAKTQFLNDYLNYIHRVEGNHLIGNQLQPSKGLNFRDVFGILKKMAQKKRADPVDVLFISRNRKIKIKTAGGHLEGDYIFYSIMDKLSREYPNIKHSIFILDDLYKGYYYSNLFDIIVAFTISSIKNLQWRYLRKGIIDRLNRNNCRHVASVASNFFLFRSLLRSSLMGYSLKRMLDMFHPKVVVINDDCITTRPICLAQVKVIIMQSARMSEHLEICRRILYEEKDTRPDYFLTSGEAFRKMKEWSGAAEKVVVTGLPRYDVLKSAPNIYSRQNFLKRFDINPEKKIVLWLTQSHALNEEENARNISTIFGTIKEVPDTFLVIKQHPAEPPRYTQMIEKMMREYEVNGILMPKDIDTYELLYISDIIIIKNSTTAMEAIVLGKPVISLNLSGQPDPVEYVREGVALGITDSRLLKDGIGQLLKDDHELAANRQKYIEEYLYKVDGQATHRVINIILDCLGKVELKN